MRDIESIIRQTFGGTTPARHGADTLDALDADTLAEVLPDYLRASIGGQQSRAVHPLMPAIARERLTLGELRQRTAITSSDLSTAMNDALAVLMTTRYASLTADIARITRAMPAPNFRKQPNVSLAIAEPALVPEDSELAPLKVTVTEGEAGELRTLGGKLTFGRRIWQTFGAELTQGVLNYADAFSAVESQWIASLLEAGTLTTATGSLDATGLASGAAALRDSLGLSGQKSNLSVAVLLVPSVLEVPARVLAGSMNNWPGTIIANSYLSSATTFYLFANPAIAGKLLRYTLVGSSGPRIFSNLRDAEKAEFAIFHDVDFGLAAGPGIVKVSP